MDLALVTEIAAGAKCFRMGKWVGKLVIL
jgi:hypothetical protein